MEMVCKVSTALTSFDRLEFAVIRERQAKPLRCGHCAEISKVRSLRIPLKSTIKQCSRQSGFLFVPYSDVTTARKAALQHERKHLGVSMGRSVICQDTQDARMNGVICAATVSRRMAAGDAGSSYLAQKLNAGTGKRNGSAGMDNPKTHAKWQLFSK